MGRFFLVLGLLAAFTASGVMYWQAKSLALPAETNRAARLDTIEPASSSVAKSPVGRCMNLGNALEAPNEGDWGYTIRDQDFNTLKAAGFDTIRVPVKWSARAKPSAPYTLRPEALKRLDWVIRRATAAGLNVIINVHHYDEINEDAERHLPRLYAIWDQLIFHYRNGPDTLMFEFLNEPHTSMNHSRVDDMNRRLLARVREIDPDRWVILGGGDWGTMNGLLSTNPPYDAHAMVTFHYYEPFEFTHQGAPWAHKKVPLGQKWGSSKDRQEMASHFARAARWRNQVGMPLLLGEFGVYEEVAPADRSLWTERVRRTAEDVGFGWCYWEFGGSMGAYDLNTESFRPGMLEALTE